MASRSRKQRRALRLEEFERRCVYASLSLGALTSSQGFPLFGADAGDESGFAVAGVGDVNRDGYEDWLIGAPRANGSTNTIEDAGEAYLIFGSATPPTSIDLNNVGTTVPGSKLFGINAYDLAGAGVGPAGDINGDGFQDFAIGAPEADGASNAKVDSGETYVLFGKSSWPATTNLSTVGTSTTGFVVFGADADDYSGCSIKSAGDVNGDGFDDLLIGAYNADGSGNLESSAGETYLLFGAASFAATIDLNQVGSSVPGSRLLGSRTDDFSGRSVSSAGDFNGDGLADLLIGAPYADALNNTKSSAGDMYIVFGSTSLAATIDLTNVGTTFPGVRFYGVDVEDYAGRSVSNAGDVNGDGFDDVLIGALFADAKNNLKNLAGESYLVFGSQNPPTVIDLTNVGLSVPGVKLFGTDIDDQSGAAVQAAGDVNGDGFDDLLIGAYAADGSNNTTVDSGETYILYGAAAMTTEIDLADVASTSIGLAVFGINADDFSGRSVSGAGDVNGDGFADFLIGSHRADGLNNAKLYAGESYLLLGGNFTTSVTHLGDTNPNQLNGTVGSDVLNGARGDDVLIGAGGNDVEIGGQGNDILAVSATSFRRIVGGTGDDTLRLDGNGLSLNLITLRDNRIIGIETIDITGNGVNTLTLNQREVLNLSKESNMLVVRRNFGDVVNIGTGWTQVANQTLGGNLFAVYTQGQATLKIQEVFNATIANRQIFYHRATGSLFGDGSGNPTGSIDPTKQALLPGQTTGFANYNNYVRGLNGLIVDVANLAGTISTADLQFATWDGVAPSNFVALAASATITVLPGVGLLGSDRIKIEFPDQAVRNTWLRVTVLANANSGLAFNDVFYFGNAVGDMNVGNLAGPPVVIRTNASDTAAVRQNQSPNINSVPIINIYDLNKDGRVNASDTANVRQNQTPTGAITFFTAPASLGIDAGLDDTIRMLSVAQVLSESRFTNAKYRTS